MEYELVTYEYGLTRQYTAYCLTPRLKNPRIRKVGRKTIVYTNEGLSSSRAFHFQSLHSALEYLRSTGAQLFNAGLRADQQMVFQETGALGD